MKTLFPASFAFSLILLVTQTYLLLYFTLVLLRRLKLLKRPYGGMELSESLPAAFVLLGVLVISTSDIAGIFQTAKIFVAGNNILIEPFLLFFARSFTILTLLSMLFVILNYLNIRYLFQGHYTDPVLPSSILLSIISTGISLMLWFVSKEIIDNMTPKFMNFQ